MWTHRFLRFTIFAVVALRMTGGAALVLPPEVAEAFRRASTGEDGSLYSPGNGREMVIGHVKTHWKELLDHLDEVPSEGGTRRSAAMVVGLAAEDLPPMEYVDFLDHYLTAYARGGIEEEVLQLQLGGRGRKNDFVVVNVADSRVRTLLLRAKELVPKENVEFQKYLDDELTGERSDMYFANKSDDALPPETLPGIELRSPFESLIAKAKRMTKASDEATKRNRPSPGNAGKPGEYTGAGTDGSEGRSRLWILAGVLVVLAFALWKGILKARLARSGSR